LTRKRDNSKDLARRPPFNTGNYTSPYDEIEMLETEKKPLGPRKIDISEVKKNDDDDIESVLSLAPDKLDDYMGKS